MQWTGKLITYSKKEKKINLKKKKKKSHKKTSNILTAENKSIIQKTTT